MNKYCMITTAIDDETIADKITEELLKKRLVSSIQKREINSSYWWDGKIENTKEYLLQMKTKNSLYKEVEIEIKNLHSYKVPEIFLVDIDNGLKSYLDWIEEETKN